MSEEKKIAGKIKNMGILDLSSLESAEELKETSSLENVGTVLIPEHLMDSFLNISMKNVGSIVPIPKGEQYKLKTGQMTLSPEFLENGDNDTLLILAGQVIIEEEVESVGFKGIYLNGQFMAPKSSQAVLEDAIERSNGQTLFFAGKKPRIFTGEQEFSREFFEYIEDTITLVLVGSSTIKGEIPPELIKEKVTEIILTGELKAEKKLLPLLQHLITISSGEIKPLEH